MEPTNKEIFDLVVMVGKHLMSINQTVVDLVEWKYDVSRLLASRLASLRPEERAALLDVVSKGETIFEHYEAAQLVFRTEFEAFLKR